MKILRRPSGMTMQLAYIALVSLYDSWLVVQHSEIILAFEQNLIGRFLIQLRGGDVSLFVGCKLLGTTGVLCALTWMGLNHRRLAVPVVRSLTVFQTWLLWFLTCSVSEDPLIPVAESLMVLTIAAICLLSLMPRHHWALAFRPIHLLMARRQFMQKRDDIPEKARSESVACAQWIHLEGGIHETDCCLSAQAGHQRAPSSA